MIPIFILSIITVYLFFERYLLLRKYTRTSSSFLDKIQDCIYAQNIRGAIQICQEENTPMSRMLVKGLFHTNLPVSELRAMTESSAGSLKHGKRIIHFSHLFRHGPDDWLLRNSCRNGTSLL